MKRADRAWAAARQRRLVPAGHLGRAAHHVADHVAAGGQRADEALVEGADEPAQVALVDEVELEILAGRDAQSAVGHLVGQGVGGEVLLGGSGAPPGRLVRTMQT